MNQIYVRPAREGLLVPFSPNRPGQFIGMRPRRKNEDVAVVAAAGTHDEPSRIKPGATVKGTEYVAASPPYALVNDTHYYRRRIAQGELALVPQSEVDAHRQAVSAALDALSEAETPATPSTDAPASDDEQPATRRARSSR